MNYLYFFIFYFSLFFTGRGLVIFLSTILKCDLVEKKIFKTELFLFYPVIALFFLGNLAVFVNFFFPMNSMRIYIFILCLFLIVLNLKYKFSFDFKDFTISNIFIPGILNISSYGIWLHYDAGLYHLNNQLWINESKVVFGLGNFNMWFSWSSLYEYISSYFWLNNNFILLHFLNLIFLSLFYSFLFYHILNKTSNFLKYSSLNVLIFGLLDNFGIQGGGNGYLYIQSVGKPDLAFTVIFYLTFIFFIDSILNEDFTLSNYIVLLYMSFFSIQLKAFGFYILPLVIYYLIKLPKVKSLVTNVKTLISLTFIWLLKNIIISGCMIFPLSISCFSSLSWYEAGKSEFAISVLSEQHIAYNPGVPLEVWFNNWIYHGKNMQIYSNFIVTFLIILFLNLILFEKSKISNLFFNFCLKAYVLLVVIFWLTSAPNPRFGMIVMLIIVSTIKIHFVERKFISKFINNKNLLLIIFFICVIATPRGYAYREMLESPLGLTQVTPPIQKYVIGTNGWSVYPYNGNKCWVNIDCMDLDRVIYKMYFNSYLLFKSENTQRFR